MRVLLALCVVLAVCLVAFWTRLGALGITDLDEGLYIAAAREMAITGDWVTPRVNGRPFFEKPPLLYWLTAASLKLAGRSESAARAPSALAMTLLCILLALFGARAFGPRTALLAACFLALSPMAVAVGRLATTDALLTLWMTAALVAGYGALRPGRNANILAAGAGLFAGLAVLAKGVVGVALPVIVLLVWRGLVCRTFRFSARRAAALWLPAAVVFALVVVPWHALAWQRNGSAFFEEYLVRQHLGRFRGGDISHRAPIWFFVPAFLAGFFPWSGFTVSGLIRPERRSQRETPQGGSDVDTLVPPPTHQASALDETLAFLRVWFWVVFIFFSLSGSKLVSYILPLYPAAALLAGFEAARVRHGGERMNGLIVGTLVACVVALAAWALLRWPEPAIAMIEKYSRTPLQLEPQDRLLLARASLVPLAVAPLLVLAAGLALARRAFASVAALIGASAVLVLLTLTVGAPVIQQKSIGSLHSLSRRAGALAEEHGVIVIAMDGLRRPSVLFYLPDRLIRERRILEIDPGDVSEAISSTATGPVLIICRSTAELALPASAKLLERRNDFALWMAPAGGNRPQSELRKEPGGAP